MENEFMWVDLLISPDVVPHHVSYAFLAAFILIGIALLLRGSMTLVPGKVQNVMEVFIDGMLDLSENTIGHKWGTTFFPYICTLFLFILICNFMGLIPGLTSPTSHLNMTLALALPVFLLYQFFGFKVHGISYLRHFMGPIQSLPALPLMVLMFVIEVISHLARPVTLSVRLFGNMTAKHLLLAVLAILVPVVVPTTILILGVLVCFVQAVVFALLTTIYIAGAVGEAH